MKLRAAVYCRLSKEDVEKIDKNQESESIVNQTMMLLDYVKQHDFELYDIYKDDDYSGLYDDRPGFEKLMEDAEARKFDVVIAKSQSRFTRNMEHLEKYLHHDFPMWGIRFISIVDNADTNLKGNKKARQINGLINEWYSEDLSESIKASFRIKQKDGQFLGSSTPYGYVKSEADRHVLTPDPYAANIVKRIFNLYLGGIGKAKIGDILTSEGVLIPSEYKRQVLGERYHNANESKGDGVWSFQTINTILHNEVYIGNLVQNKCSKKSFKDRKKQALPKSKWITVEHTHEPIIDKETFDKVQDELKNRRVEINLSEKERSLFAKHIFCGDCGKSMTPVYTKPNKNGERRRLYLCGQYKKFGNKYCTSHAIAEAELIEIVRNDIHKQGKLLMGEKTKSEIMRYRDVMSPVPDRINLQELKAGLAKIEGYKEKAFENFADGTISKDDFLKLKKSYEEKARNIEKEILIAERDSVQAADRGKFEEWLEKLSNCLDTEHLTREMVTSLIHSIYVYDDNVIQINYKFRNAVQ